MKMGVSDANADWKITIGFENWFTHCSHSFLSIGSVCDGNEEILQYIEQPSKIVAALSSLDINVL